MVKKLGLVVAAAVLLSACGASGVGGAPADVGASPTAGSASASLEPLGDVTLQGDSFDSETLGGKSVVLWFWAPWCTICRAEGPSVAEVAEQLDGEVTFVGVPGLGEQGAMRSFVSDTGTESLLHIPDLDGSTWTAYGVVSQPAFVFITPSGAVQTFTGALGSDKLKDAAESLTVDPA